MFIDTHCHLDFKLFADDLPDVLARAKLNNVMYFINPAIDLKSSNDCLSLAQKNPEILAAIGIHPNDIDDMSLSNVKQLEHLLPNDKIVAIGEVGLDYFHNISDCELQKYVFNKQLELAIMYNLPVIIHSREAMMDVISSLKMYYQKPANYHKSGILHSFEGTPDEANQVIEMGFLIGIGGPVTYKNSRLKHSLVRELSLSSIVLETDSPYLPPSPLRGTRNEPANIKIIAEKIANIKECDIKQVEIRTTQNALSLFRIGEEIDLN